MANHEKQSRIEAVFSNIGLGNSDPERITQIIQDHERAMTTADFTPKGTKRKKFKNVLADAESKVEEEK